VLLVFEGMGGRCHERLNGGEPTILVGEQLVDGDVGSPFSDVPGGRLEMFFDMGTRHCRCDPIQIGMTEIEESNGVRLSVEIIRPDLSRSRNRSQIPGALLVRSPPEDH
jgi:hypothetical protein